MLSDITTSFLFSPSSYLVELSQAHALQSKLAEYWSDIVQMKAHESPMNISTLVICLGKNGSINEKKSPQVKNILRREKRKKLYACVCVYIYI